MFHICFYLRLDIVYVYVMPRPPSIETIPGAPLDQAKFPIAFLIGLQPQVCSRGATLHGRRGLSAAHLWACSARHPRNA